MTWKALIFPPAVLSRIFHTIFRGDPPRCFLPAFRSIFVWTGCLHTALRKNPGAPWRNGARGVSRRKSVAVSGLLALALSACGDKGQNGEPGAESRASLTVGMEMANPPFEMRGPGNRPDGISIRMAEDLAARLKRSLKVLDIEWNGLIPSLKTGKIDLIISSLTRTPERAGQIDFSDGYVTNGLCLLVAKNSSIQSVSDIRGGKSKVAVKLATTGYQWAAENLPGVELIVLDESATCVLEVVQGKADAFIYDQISIYRYWKQHQADTRPILKPIREETWSIGIRKGNDDLRKQVNTFLRDYRKNGRFDELAERYMAEEKHAFEKLGVPFIFH